MYYNFSKCPWFTIRSLLRDASILEKDREWLNKEQARGEKLGGDQMKGYSWQTFCYENLKKCIFFTGVL